MSWSCNLSCAYNFSVWRESHSLQNNPLGAVGFVCLGCHLKPGQETQSQHSRLLIDLVTVLAVRREKISGFFSVGFKCLSPLLTAPPKSQVFIIVQEQLSPFSPEKLVTGLNEDLRELVSVFSSNISLSNLDEAFCPNFLICKMGIMMPASFLWCFEVYWLKMLLWPFL